jgi:hypothetical protein
MKSNSHINRALLIVCALSLEGSWNFHGAQAAERVGTSTWDVGQVPLRVWEANHQLIGIRRLMAPTRSAASCFSRFLNRDGDASVAGNVRKARMRASSVSVPAGTQRLLILNSEILQWPKYLTF